MTLVEMAEELEANVESVRLAAKRGTGKSFVAVTGADGIERWGLLSRRDAA
jgi:hypothetical protein